MIKGVRRLRLVLCVLLSGTVVQMTACQLLSGQAGDVGAAFQAFVGDIETFVLDFARQVVQAAVL
jgi:hypothetical protein